MPDYDISNDTSPQNKSGVDELGNNENLSLAAVLIGKGSRLLEPTNRESANTESANKGVDKVKLSSEKPSGEQSVSKVKDNQAATIDKSQKNNIETRAAVVEALLAMLVLSLQQRETTQAQAKQAATSVTSEQPREPSSANTVQVSKINSNLDEAKPEVNLAKAESQVGKNDQHSDSNNAMTISNIRTSNLPSPFDVKSPVAGLVARGYNSGVDGNLITMASNGVRSGNRTLAGRWSSTLASNNSHAISGGAILGGNSLSASNSSSNAVGAARGGGALGAGGGARGGGGILMGFQPSWHCGFLNNLRSGNIAFGINNRSIIKDEEDDNEDKKKKDEIV